MYVHSRVTHSAGGEWAPLRVPENDPCPEQDPRLGNVSCSLHLQMQTSRMANVLSHASAVGIVMGNGTSIACSRRALHIMSSVWLLSLPLARLYYSTFSGTGEQGLLMWAQAMLANTFGRPR